MLPSRLVDTLPSFLSYWAGCQDQPLDVQVALWEEQYMAAWPALFRLVQDDYASEGEDWRDVARTRILPSLPARLGAITLAHLNLLDTWPTISRAAQTVLRFEEDVVCVVYVGLGCGAGWVTPYAGQPAVLFGLEMIAECGWEHPPSLTGLVAHEMGHVAQNVWRAERGSAQVSGPWWQLFSEGFAQRCEHVILGEETWHEQAGLNDDDWLTWCRANRGWLAGEFLRRVDAGENARPFFGSWYELCGHRQCGYYLGHEVVRALEGEASLQEIAVRDDVEAECRAVLERFARG